MVAVEEEETRSGEGMIQRRMKVSVMKEEEEKPRKESTLEKWEFGRRCCIMYVQGINKTGRKLYLLLLKPDGPKASMRRNPKGWLHWLQDWKRQDPSVKGKLNIILSFFKKKVKYFPFSCVCSESLCNMAAGRETLLSKKIQVAISPEKCERKHWKLNLDCFTSLAGFLVLLAKEQLSTEELMLWMFFWCAILQRILSIFGPKLTSWG